MSGSTQDPSPILAPPTASASPTLTDRLQNVYEPTYLYALAAWSFVRVFLSTLLHQPFALLPISRLRDRSFGEMWISLGMGDPGAGPLKGVIPLIGSATGVILELGPGTGDQARWITNPEIEAVYGVEPCLELHAPLKKTIAMMGLDGRYHVLPCGGERDSLRPGLKEAGLLNGTGDAPIFDTIICSKVLCSIPNPEDTVDSLYGLLKPGGKILVCEHIKNQWRTPKGSIASRLVQAFFMLIGWTFFMGGCHLDRNTLQVFKDVGSRHGGWDTVDLDLVMEWGSLPFVLGELVKKS